MHDEVMIPPRGGPMDELLAIIGANVEERDLEFRLLWREGAWFASIINPRIFDKSLHVRRDNPLEAVEALCSYCLRQWNVNLKDEDVSRRNG